MAAGIVQCDFVGRDREYGLLQSILENVIAKGNEKSVVFISGETGIGKTRLVEELCNYARSTNVRVGIGNCIKELPSPYLPIKDALKKIELDHLAITEKPPFVECVYIVNKAGLLMCKTDRSGRRKIDPDIFMGMLNAVAEFVKDSMQLFETTDQQAFLSRLDYGERTILVNQGRLINLVVIITGTENEFLKDDMDYMLAHIESKFSDFLKKWDGSITETVVEIEKVIQTLITSGKYDGIDYGYDDTKVGVDKLYANLTKGLVRESKKQPILLVIEDIHHASSSLLTFLHYFARNTIGEHILLVCTYRVEEMSTKLVETVQALNIENLNVSISLERFLQSTTEMLVNSVFKSHTFKLDFIKRIHKETDGNPFFILEILNLLLEKGYVKKDNNIWYLTDEIDKIEIPQKVYDVISNRISRLSNEECDLLRCASVIGDVFHHNLLACASKKDKMTLLKKLESLENQKFVVHHKDTEYLFAHPKIKEVLYSTMSAPLRMEYHLAVANCIERIYDFEDKIEKLAYHFYRSAKPEKSIKYLIRSAENAVKNYAVEDAIRYYEDCATLIKKPTEKIELFEKLADLLCIVGKYDDAIKTYSECSRMTYILDMKLQTGMLKLKIGNAYEKKSAYKDAERNYTEALELIKSAKGLESIEGAQIYNAIGWLYFRSANYDKAIAYSLKALSIAESHHFEREIGVAFHQIGTNYLRKGEYRLAEDFLKKALAIREAIDDINGISATYNTLGAVYRELGEHENALESFKKSLAINEKVGDNWRIATSYINIGNLHYQKGRLTDAEECYLKSLVIKESIGDLAGVGVVYNNLAIICYEKGKLEDAMQYYKKSMTIKETTKDTYGIALCCINLGILYKETNAYEDAIKYYKRGMELSQQIGEKYILAWCYGGLAEVYAETGNTSEGLEIGKKALSLAHQIDSPDMIGFTTRALAICYTRMAMWLDAEEHYKHCIEIYRQTGNELELAQSFYEYALMFKKRAERNDRNRAAHYLNIAKDIFYRNNASYGISKCEKILDELKTETEKLK